MICFVDYRITIDELKSLEKYNLDPILIPKSNDVYSAIDGHVDIQLNILNKKERSVIVQKNIDKDFLHTLKSNNIKYILSENTLNSTYPKDIILNALILDNYFIHNLKYTDSNLLESQTSKEHINVKQGYTKCSVLPISQTAFITSDKKIANTLNNLNMDVLVVPPGDIICNPLDYGFIGGVGGLISENKLALFGNLKNYKYGNEVLSFLHKHDVEPIYLHDGKLYDRGSLFVV